MGRSREGRLQLGSIGLVVHVFNILIFRRASERVRAREYIRTGNIEWCDNKNERETSLADKPTGAVLLRHGLPPLSTYTREPQLLLYLREPAPFLAFHERHLPEPGQPYPNVL